MRIAWKGEDTEEQAGPSFTFWNGMKFPKGQMVEISDPQMMRKAVNNQFFDVEDSEPRRGPGRPKKVEVDGSNENPG